MNFKKGALYFKHDPIFFLQKNEDLFSYHQPHDQNASSTLISILEHQLEIQGDKHSFSFYPQARDALYHGLMALKLPPWAEVIVPSMCCGSVIEAIIQAHLIPVLCDTDNQYQLSLESVKQAHTPNTQVVLNIHLGGSEGRDFFFIQSFCQQNRIHLIEDAAQAAGLKLSNGKMAGTQGIFSILSMGLGKLHFNPRGGILVSHSESFSKNLQALPLSPLPDAHHDPTYLSLMERKWESLYGKSAWNRLIHRGSTKLGLKSTAPLAPSFALTEKEKGRFALQWNKTPEIVEKVLSHAQLWKTCLQPRIDSQDLRVPSLASSTGLKFWIRFEDPQQKSQWQQFFYQKGIETEAFYTPLFLRPRYQKVKRGPVEILSPLDDGLFCLPTRETLTPSQVHRISEALKQVQVLYPPGRATNKVVSSST